VRCPSDRVTIAGGLRGLGEPSNIRAELFEGVSVPAEARQRVGHHPGGQRGSSLPEGSASSASSAKAS
jgi:pyridoxal biosynthesis lyase PdxS